MLVIQWGYNYYLNSDEIEDYGITPEGEKVPNYKRYCSFYITKEDEQGKYNDRLYIQNSYGKITIVEKEEKVKDVLKSIDVEKNYTYFGGKLNFHVTTTEPVKSVSLWFYSGTEKTYGHYPYNISFNTNLLSSGDKTDFTYTVNAPSNIEPGNFFLDSILVYYDDGSYVRYSTDKTYADMDPDILYYDGRLKLTLGKPLLDILKDAEFSLKGLTLQKQSAEIGMTVPVNFDWYYNSVNIRMLSARLFFRGEDNKSFSAYLKDLKKDTTIIIPSSAEEGEYKLESLTLTFDSYVGETNVVVLDEETVESQYKDIFTQKLNIVKKEESKPVNDTKLYYYVEELTPKSIETIKNSKQNSVITIYANSETVIPAELFESLKESGRQVIIINEKNEWVISGTDIESTKPVDVSMKYYDVKELDVPAELKESFSGDSVVLEFKENGKLPGKVLMRLKDEELLNKLSGDKYYIYHIDEENNKLDKVAVEIQKSYDGYVEFYINHNSKYVITTKEVKDNDVIGKEDDMFVNNTSVVASHETNKDNDSKSNMLLAVCLCVIAVLILIIIVILRRKPSNEKKANVKELKDDKLDSDDKKAKDEETKNE